MKSLSLYRLILSLMIITSSSQILFGQTDSSKKSVVYWLNGVDDSYLPWSLYNDAFSNEFLIKGINLQYPSNKPIFYLGQDVRNTVDTQLFDFYEVNDQYPIAICHDIGGLLVRSIEQENKRLNHHSTFRGIITVSTPHQGSSFVKALKNDDFSNLVGRFFTPYLDPIMAVFAFRKAKEYRQAQEVNMFVQTNRPGISEKKLMRYPVNNPSAIKMRVDTVPSFIAKKIGQSISYYLTKWYFNNNVIEDMTPNSNFLFQLNDSISSPQNTVPTINIVSSHSDLPVYHFLYSSVFNHPSSDSLDQHQDDGVANVIKEVAGIYRAIAGVFMSPIPRNFVRTPQIVDATVEANSISQDFIQAARALEKDFPDGASMIVGSIVKEYEVLGQKFVREVPNEDGIPIFRLVVDEKEIVKRIEGDDGMLSETAQKDPNRLPDDIRPIRNANHIGITNNRNFRLELSNNIFSDPRFIVYRKN